MSFAAYEELAELRSARQRAEAMAQLRELEADGLVKRQVFHEVPPRVEYSATKLGNSLNTALAPLADRDQIPDFLQQLVLEDHIHPCHRSPPLCAYQPTRFCRDSLLQAQPRLSRVPPGAPQPRQLGVRGPG